MGVKGAGHPERLNFMSPEHIFMRNGKNLQNGSRLPKWGSTIWMREEKMITPDSV